MSKIEPDRNVAQASPRNDSFKVATIFLLVGPPTFGPLFYLATSIANHNADTLSSKINETLGMVFSFYGLVASYVVGFVPSLISGFAYLRSGHQRTIGHRLLVATLIGAAVYFVVCALVLFFLYAGRIETGAWPFTAYAAGAGAVSAVLCALIVENYTKPIHAA